MDEFQFIKLPVYRGQYQFHKGGGIRYGAEFLPGKFHRFMQRLCLGIIWTEITDK